MVKVTKGTFSGQRPTGYQFYTQNVGIGSSTTVRRVNPTDARQTLGTSPAQKRQKEVFGLAAKMYAGWTIHERDFYTRVRRLSIHPTFLGKEVRKFLIGRELALNDIISYLNTPQGTFKTPLGFCVYAKDCNRAMTTGNTLRITSEKLPDYLYEETNGEGSHFPASSLSPLYEPYHIEIDGRDLGFRTAQELHKSRYIGLYDYKAFWNAGWHSSQRIPYFWWVSDHFKYKYYRPGCETVKMKYHIWGMLTEPRFAKLSIHSESIGGLTVNAKRGTGFDEIGYGGCREDEPLIFSLFPVPAPDLIFIRFWFTAEFCYE